MPTMLSYLRGEVNIKIKQKDDRMLSLEKYDVNRLEGKQ